MEPNLFNQRCCSFLIQAKNTDFNLTNLLFLKLCFCQPEIKCFHNTDSYDFYLKKQYSHINICTKRTSNRGIVDSELAGVHKKRGADSNNHEGSE